jgi:two-component system cell cycle sensor histidine kinase/response regulator CckA
MSPVILVVDDEKNVRDLVRYLLERAGYRVIEADNAETALELLQERLLEPQLLLTDIVMPAMSGLALAAQAHHLRPSIPVIFMTGFANEYQAELCGSVCLRKPFKPSELLAAVQDVVGSPGRAPVGAPDEDQDA